MKKKHYKLDKELIRKLATIHCTYQEIADVVGTSVTTLEQKVRKVLEENKWKLLWRRAMLEC
jgi:uncharacterized protein YoxC